MQINPTKIHASKSNPNLINNEIQLNDANGASSKNEFVLVQTFLYSRILILSILIIKDGTIPVIITSMTPTLTSANNSTGNSSAFQNLTNSPSLNSNTTKHSRNLSNVSTDESIFKVNFYQGAKSSKHFIINFGIVVMEIINAS